MKSIRFAVLTIMVAVLILNASLRTVVAADEDRAGWPSNFIIGIFASDDAEKALKSAEPLRAYLESALKMRVVMYTGGSYTAVITAMKAGRVDAMEVGPLAYILAVQEAKAEALAVGAPEGRTPGKETKYIPDYLPFYYSIIVTKKGSGITKIADLKGKDFAFVDPASTSGHLMPKSTLIKSGIDPDKDMKTIFAGSHPTTVQAVWSDKVPAGATFLGNIMNMAKEGQIDFCMFPDGNANKMRTQEEVDALFKTCKDGQLAMIAMSDPIPNTPFSVNSALPESFKKAVKDALLAIKDSPEALKQIGGWYVDPAEALELDATDNFYDGLREVAKILGLDLKGLVK